MTVPSPGSESLLAVGVASAVVEVPARTRLSGYAARTGGSDGTHDPCTARALAVEETCWVVVDVCALHEETCDAIVERLGLDPSDVAVTATHTHAGPVCTPGRLGGDDEVVRGRIVDAVVEAVTAARVARAPARLWRSASRGVGVAVDRRDPTHDIDPPVDLVGFERPDGSVAAWLVSYPCHPVVLGADNLLVSGDYAHYLRAELEQSAPGSVALFLPGTAGDVNNGHAAEASFTAGPQAGRTFVEAERVGRHTALVALSAPRHGMPVGHLGASSTRRLVPLSLRTLDTQPHGILAGQWAVRARDADPAEAAVLRAWIDWAGQRREDDPMSWTAAVTVMRWGAVTVVGVPGEPFVSFGELVRDSVVAARPGGAVIVTGYTNGCPGYLPEASAYARGGYEVVDAHRYYGMPAPFAEGSAEALLAVATELALAP